MSSNPLNRTALVTGGTRGIGAAISLALIKSGYKVGATYHSNTPTAEKFAESTGIKIFRWDVSDFDACRSGVAEVSSTLGPIDILINNAGITRDSMLHKMTLDQWRQTISTNLDSCFNMTRAVITSMREREFGRIINISSVNGQKGQMGQANYSAAKSGIIGFTKAIAQENASKKITANVIAPGYVDTEMVRSIPCGVLEKIVSQIPTGRLGTVEEIAHAVTFLASDEAGFITGSTLSINGGQYFS